MKTRRLLLSMLTAMIFVVGCGGTGAEKSATLTFEMAIQQAEGEYLIYGTVYNDRNKNQVMDMDDFGIPNITVTLLGMDKVAMTAGDGSYSFAVIASGMYSVVETDPEGYISTTLNEVSVEVVDADVEVNFGDYMEQGLSVDVKPGSDINPLNLKSNGVLPVAILGSEAFDVAQIDPESLFLNGVSPLRWSFEDVCGLDLDDDEVPDGYEDMTLKFSTQEITDSLGDVVRGDIVTLTMTGSLLDDSSIWGEETVWIVQIPKE